MPHIILEYSDELHAQALNVMREVHQHITQCGICDPQAVKARCLPYRDVLLPEGARNFMHITISLLEGRMLQERQQLSREIFDLAKRIVMDVDRLSVDIAEMTTATYSK